MKFRLLDVEEPGPHEQPIPRDILINGSVKGIGARATLEIAGQGVPHTKSVESIADHAQAVRCVFAHLPTSLAQVEAIGHRVVHGGERFSDSIVINDGVIKEIDALSELAPLHNPACLEGIQGARAVLGPTVPMVAVFDTAFHRTMPAVAGTYALPYELAAKHRIRRYGFHGIAHASLVDGYLAHTGKPAVGSRLITFQLGNGCSVTAVSGGRSVDTSMGFTPLEGLVMGTRSGDVDPSVVNYLAQREKVEASEVERWLNEESGLLGISGRTNDMRDLLHAAADDQDTHAKLAIELFCYRAKKYIGTYLAVLGGADAIVFGGGIGEASPDIRARICAGMDWCGLRLDAERNRSAVSLEPGTASLISPEGAGLSAYVVAADEETWIAKETVRCLRKNL